MKIVNREDFLKLPPHTLYCKYEPLLLPRDTLQIKLDTCIDSEGKGFDWFLRSIVYIESDSQEDFHSKMTKMEVEGCSYPLDCDDMIREGAFEDNQLYLVYEDDDVKALIEELTKCLTKGERDV